MMNELEFMLPTTITLAEMDAILTKLDIDDNYGIGGDYCIEFYLDGRIIMHEIEDEHMPTILQIIYDARCWPCYLLVRGEEISAQDLEEAKEKLGDLDRQKQLAINSGYEALWAWIQERVSKDHESTSQKWMQESWGTKND